MASKRRLKPVARRREAGFALPKAITAWAEVGPDGRFTVYDLAPTKAGIVCGKLPTSRAVKVRIVPMEKRK